MIREKHGVAEARKITMIQGDDTQAVDVIDGDGEVNLRMSTSSYPAGLTPEQARFLAKQLIASAKRVEKSAA